MEQLLEFMTEKGPKIHGTYFPEVLYHFPQCGRVSLVCNEIAERLLMCKADTYLNKGFTIFARDTITNEYYLLYKHDDCWTLYWVKLHERDERRLLASPKTFNM